MPRLLPLLLIASAVVALLGACAHREGAPDLKGRWIRFEASSQRYSIDAQQVPRGALLDELKKLVGADVRPQPERETPITVQAGDLDLDALVGLLLPAGTRPTVRHGEREVAAAVPKSTRPKQGATMPTVDGLRPKPDATRDAADLVRTGTLKAASDATDSPREVSGPGTKPQALALVRVAVASGPKKPPETRPPRSSLRLQFLFEEGAPPRLIDARSVEGRVRPHRVVAGEYLFAITAADGRILEAGSFQDPLIEHSYLPEGPHTVGRARSGIAGISILLENLAGSVLHIVDITGVPMPRELDERAVRSALERGKPTLRLESASIQRRLDQEGK